VQTTDGATPLYVACLIDDADLVALLLGHGAAVNLARVCVVREGPCFLFLLMFLVGNATAPVKEYRVVCKEYEARRGSGADMPRGAAVKMSGVSADGGWCDATVYSMPERAPGPGRHVA
jgi:hypothetical protein